MLEDLRNKNEKTVTFKIVYKTLTSTEDIDRISKKMKTTNKHCVRCSIKELEIYII